MTTATTATDTSAAAEDAAREQLVNELKGKHPGRELRTAQHDVLPDWIIFKVPTGPEYRIYRLKRAEDDGKNGKKWDAFEMLVFACTVFPEKDDLRRQLDAHPALLEVWAGEILDARFSRLFFAIWLAPTTSEPGLRQALLAGTPP